MNEITQEQEVSSNDEDDKDTVPVQTSFFFGRFSIWFFIAILIISIWFRQLPLIVLSTFLILLSAMITLWKNRSLIHITPTLDIPKSRLFADETFSVHASILNDKWLPLIWIEWKFPEYPEIIWGDDKRDKYIIRFLWLLWYQSVEWTLEGKATGRGVYSLGNVRLRSGDGFRFSETEQTQRLDKYLYVYPKLIPVHTSQYPLSLHWNAIGRQGGFLEDPLLMSGVKDYQSGDEWRRLNWKASARTGELKTNVYQPIMNPELMIGIDVDGFQINETAYEEPEKQKEYAEKMKWEFEHFLSVIASVAVSRHEQGIPIGYASNAVDCFGLSQEKISPSTNLTSFLDQIAMITAKMSKPRHAKLAGMLGDGNIKSPLIVFCRTISKEYEAWYQQNRQKMSDVRFYYQLESEHSAKMASLAKPITSFTATSISN